MPGRKPKTDASAAPAPEARPPAIETEDFYRNKYHELRERVKELERELGEQKKLTKIAENQARRARGAFENAMRTMQRLKRLVDME